MSDFDKWADDQDIVDEAHELGIANEPPLSYPEHREMMQKFGEARRQRDIELDRTLIAGRAIGPLREGGA